MENSQKLLLKFSKKTLKDLQNVAKNIKFQVFASTMLQKPTTIIVKLSWVEGWHVLLSTAIFIKHRGCRRRSLQFATLWPFIVSETQDFFW